MKKLIFLLLMGLSIFSFAQISDDFESGVLTNWSQTLNHFDVSDSLPINGSYSFHHVYFTDVTDNYKDTASCPIGNLNLTAGTTTWQFQIRYNNSNPSGTNNWNIFLMSDGDFSQMPTVNGYVIGVNYGSTTDDILTLKKVSNGTGYTVIQTSFKWDSAATVGLKVTRSSDGNWEVFIDTINGGFDNLVSIGTGSSSTFITANYFGVYYKYTKTNCRKFWLDDLSITGIAGNNDDSYISAGTDAEPATISSIINEADGVQVFDVAFTDAGTSDGKPTIIDSIFFSQGTNNEISDWTSVIAGAKLFGNDLTSGMSGTITNNGISFATDSMIIIDDNNSETYKLQIWLKNSLPDTADNKNLVFKLDYNDIFTNINGSSFGSGTVESGDNNNAIDIAATKLTLFNIPTSIAQNSDFSISVKATDINGNTDKDATNAVTLSAYNGTGNLTSSTGLTQNLSQGQYSWTDLQYDQLENFQIIASATGLIADTTPYIECSEYIYYLQDNFEDGDLVGWEANEPSHWQASDIEPINGIYSLHQIYDASTYGNDIISYQLPNVDLSSDSIIWQFQLKYGYNSPSSTNNWNIFLSADADNSEMFNGGNINGYVLGVNFSGTDDLLKLWRVDNGSATAIISTSFDWNTTDETTPKGFIISRSATGLWEIKIDENGGFDDLLSLGTNVDSTYKTANYFGVEYKYSSTHDKILWLDDIYMGPPIPDTEKPFVDTVYATTPNTLKVLFNEDVSNATVQNLSNFTVDNSIGNPQSATLDTINQRLVTLSFSNTFQDDTQYSLNIKNIEDESGNVINDTNITFIWQNIHISSLRFLSTKKIDVKFSKTLDATSAEILTNYDILDTIGNPLTAKVDSLDSTIVHLTFEKEMQYAGNYILHVENIQDKLGNIIDPTDFPFTFYIVRRNDVVINELMIDVNPAPVALPAHKFIELYNVSDFDIDMADWTMKIGTNNNLIFPKMTLASGEYAIICAEDADSLFTPYGKTIPILKESYLTSTTGKLITIKNTQGNVIEQIKYSPDWYGDPDKDDGGWSLERIDPTNYCSQDNNWHVTENYTGGTPAMQNSVYGSNPDTQAPHITDITLLTSADMRITYSETIDTTQALAMISYILNGNTTPILITLDEDDNSIVYLHFLEHFLFSDNSMKISGIRDYCGNIMPDTTISFYYQLVHPTDVEPKSSTQLKVYFSEPVNKSDAENLFNYTVNKGIGNPIVATRDANDSSVVHLLFDNEFAQDSAYELSMIGISDINGNTMNDEEIVFHYHVPKPFDIVINEMMLDINPAPLGLPEAQYVELFNTSDFDIWLSDWIFIAESQKERDFPIVKIPSKGFVLLCNEEDEEQLQEYGVTVPILGTTDLTQTGKELKIFDNRNNLIYHVRYSDTWYNDDTKDDGGWSLEKIDPFNFCESSFNWAASTDVSGGTPGRDNSVYHINNDTTVPQLTSLSVKASNRLFATFSKSLNFETGLDTANYYVQGIGYAQSVTMSDTSYSAVNIYFQNQFSDAQQYTLKIQNVTDDCGNAMETTNTDFTYYLIHPEYVWTLSDNQLKIKFSEEVEYNSALVKDNYLVDNQIGYPNYVVRGTEDPSEIFLQFDNKFTDGQTYTITISNLKDINENTMQKAELEFTYYVAKPNDIVINEILFNPHKGGADFVELYNRSQYSINLLDLTIAKRDDDGEITSPYKISQHNYMFLPHTYLVLTTDTADITTTYTCGDSLLQLDNMPAYPDDEGDVVIYNDNDSIIDEFHYSDDMHFALISDDEGVSLERIDYDMPTQDTSNWHSAAESAGFATPGLINSQYKKMSDMTTIGEVSLTPQVFSPDNDGYNDQLYINYDFDEGGYVADVLIFDKNGILVRHLVTDELIGSSGYWLWDGLDKNNVKVRIGMYGIVIKIFDLDGNVHIFRKTAVVAGKK